MVYESLVKPQDLMMSLLEEDLLDDDIRWGYKQDKVFSKVMEKPEDHPDFEVKDVIIWMKNRGGEQVVCVPSMPSKGTTLHGHIIDQAHSIIRHFGPVKTSEYVW